MKLSRDVGRFRLDRVVIALLLIVALLLGARSWMHAHPQHNPWAPLNLSHEPGWATDRKLGSLRGSPAECLAVLERSGVPFATLEPTGEGACRLEDRTVLSEAPLSPAQPSSTCAVAAGLEYWQRHGLSRAAVETLGSPVVKIEHVGTYSCRRMYGRDEGPWSEHATANAIDVTGFVLEDGRRISVLDGWQGDGPEAAFLRQARDGACEAFGTVLSPDYNAAHADHLHLDQQGRMWGVCR